MSDSGFRVRVHVNAHEVEIEGDKEFVDKYWAELRPMLAESSLLAEPTQPAEEQMASIGEQDNNGVQDKTNGLPDSFGEFFSGFNNLNQIDLALVAAYYIQKENSEDSTFTTREVNDLLKEHGEKLSNASTCIRRICSAKRAFKYGKGFRVSNTGEQYVQELLSQNSDAS